MSVIESVTSALPGIPIEHLIALIALSGFALCGFALYLVFAIVVRKRK